MKSHGPLVVSLFVSVFALSACGGSPTEASAGDSADAGLETAPLPGEDNAALNAWTFVQYVAEGDIEMACKFKDGGFLDETTDERCVGALTDGTMDNAGELGAAGSDAWKAAAEVPLDQYATEYDGPDQIEVDIPGVDFGVEMGVDDDTWTV